MKGTYERDVTHLHWQVNQLATTIVNRSFTVPIPDSFYVAVKNALLSELKTTMEELPKEKDVRPFEKSL